jgi:pimeloyl-ACP methyl ester carboxylesterase
VTDHFEGRFSLDWPGRDSDDDGCRVVAIGDDSLTAEGLDDPSQMWLARALEAIHRHTGWGLTLAVIARRGTRLRDAERLARFIDDEDPGVVVLSVGTNDAIGLNESMLATPTVGLRDYANRYRQLIRAVRGRGRMVVATGVPNLRHTPRGRWALWPAGTVSRYVDRAIARATTDIHGVVRIDIRQADRTMWANRRWLYRQSGWQPTAAGHDVWAGLAGPALTRAVKKAHKARVPPAGPGHRVRARSADTYKFVRTSQGVARVRDTGGKGIAVVVMPDSPNVLEHHESSFTGLAGRYRVVGLEMPGAGYTDLRSSPHDDLPRFDFSLDAGAGWILDVLRAVDAKKAVLTGSCVNGLYAARAAQLDPDRVRALVVCQTPSLGELKSWATTTIPAIVRHPLGDRLLLQRTKRRAAARWYSRALAPGTSSEKRAWFEDVARAGFRAGSAWRLAPLINAFLAEPDDRLDFIPVPTTVLWGSHDLTHRHAGTDPMSLVRGQRPLFVDAGHFPDLEQPDRFACEVVKVIQSLA